MKKTIAYLFLLSLLVVASCSKNEDVVPTIENSLIGKWVAEKDESDAYIEGQEYNFKSDGTLIGYHIGLIYEDNESNVIIGRRMIQYSGTYKVSDDGKLLTVVELKNKNIDEDRTRTFHIEFITGTKLTMKETFVQSWYNDESRIITYNKQ